MCQHLVEKKRTGAKEGKKLKIKKKIKKDMEKKEKGGLGWEEPLAGVELLSNSEIFCIALKDL